MLKITAGIITRNEEQLLPHCLKSIQPIADEIIVVDTGSTDRTVQIARKFGARIHFYRWDNNYARARNVYVKAATNPWILSIDADETIASCDLPKITKLIKGSTSCYLLKSRVYTSTVGTAMNWRPLDGKYPQEENRSKAAGFISGRFTRLFRKGKNIFCDERVHLHESVRYAILKAGGRIEEADITLHDFSCLNGDAYTLRKQRRYFQINMNEIFSRHFNEHELKNFAIGCILKKNPDKALTLLRQALKRNKTYIPAHYLSAVAYREKACLEKATACLKNIFIIKKNYPDALWLMGICLDDLNRPNEGLVYVRRSLKQIPNHAIYLNSLGVVYCHLDRLPEAKKAFEKSVAMLPSYKQPQLNLSALKKI